MAKNKVTFTEPRKRRGKVDLEQLMFRSGRHKYRKIVRAIVARTLLIAHASYAIYICGLLKDTHFLMYGVLLFLFIPETITILYFRYGCEWKR